MQDELLSTELLFRSLLTGMAPEEAVALMSALVFQVSTDPHTAALAAAAAAPPKTTCYLMQHAG
jgi:superfamily II RNA helicase